MKYGLNSTRIVARIRVSSTSCFKGEEGENHLYVCVSVVIVETFKRETTCRFLWWENSSPSKTQRKVKFHNAKYECYTYFPFDSLVGMLCGSHLLA